jgi:hypothetical protein
MPDRPITAALLAVATIIAAILACLVLTLALHLTPTHAATPTTPTTTAVPTAAPPAPAPGEYIPTPAGPPATTTTTPPGPAMTTLGAPILAGLLPPRGALVGIVALIALALLDRIPLRAYRPHPDDRDRIPRHRPRRAPTVTLTRPDPHPARPAGRAIQQRTPTSPAIAPRTDTREGR